MAAKDGAPWGFDIAMTVGNTLDIPSENRAHKSMKTLLYHQHRRMT